MKAGDCRNVTREIDELDRGQQAGPAVLAHIQGCNQCREFHDDRLKLRQMVAGLGSVEAPADFDFRLRARLAGESGTKASGVSLKMFGFGLPTVALATIAILIGVGLATRVLMEPGDNSSVASQESVQPERPSSGSTVAQESSGDNGETPKQEAIVSNKPEVMTRANDRFANSNVRSRRRVASKDFSSNPAVVLKREDLLAGTESVAMFPLEASEPLRVSMDDGTGVSRTISVPTLSFGSQHVVSRGSSMVKASARTVW